MIMWCTKNQPCTLNCAIVFDVFGDIYDLPAPACIHWQVALLRIGGKLELFIY